MAIYLKQFETQAAYEAAESGLILPNVSLTLDNNAVHYKPWVDPCISEKVETTYEWVKIGGVKWATKNVGAKTITDYGQYFSWGGVNGFTADQVTGGCRVFSWADYELANGSESDITKYNSSDGKTVLESVDDAVIANLGGSWRMPTKDEFQSLIDATTNAWTSITIDNVTVSGIMFTDKTDSSKTLFFPAAGRCNDGSVKFVGSIGNYRSSSLYSNNVKNAYTLNFNNSGYVTCNVYSSRYIAYPVRGVIGE